MSEDSNLQTHRGCAICLDERQYVGAAGRQWTTLPELRERLRADVRGEEPGLTGIGSTPSFAIGRRPSSPGRRCWASAATSPAAP